MKWISRTLILTITCASLIVAAPTYGGAQDEYELEAGAEYGRYMVRCNTDGSYDCASGCTINPNVSCNCHLP
jgi:hypothetical protein